MGRGKSMTGCVAQIVAALLSAACVTVAGEPANNAASETKPRKVAVGEFEKLWKTGTNIVLDVRTKKEFDDGHIPGAVNIDYNSPAFAREVGRLDMNKVYLVHCAAGVRR